MYCGNFHGTPSTPVASVPFDVLSSFEEDNVPVAFRHYGGRAAANPSSSHEGKRDGFHHDDDDGNSEGEGVTPDDSFLEELYEIQHLPLLDIIPLATVLLKGESSLGHAPSVPGPPDPKVGVRVDERHRHFFN